MNMIIKRIFLPQLALDNKDKKILLKLKRGKVKNKNISAFATLLSVLVLGALFSVLSVLFLNSSLNNNLNSYVRGDSLKAKAAADSCVDLALMELKNQENFSGSGSLSINHGFCYFNVLQKNNGEKEIQAEGVVNNLYKRSLIMVSEVNPFIVIDFWKEVSDF